MTKEELMQTTAEQIGSGAATVLVTMLVAFGLGVAFIVILIAMTAYYSIAWPFYLIRAVIRRLG
jgi:hypothetical protein